MTPEELIRARRNGKRALYMRKIGKPMLVLPEEVAAAKARMTDYHSRGMAFSDMAGQTGGALARHTIGDLVAGRKKTLRRDTYNAIMRIRFRAPGPTSGSYVDGIGTARRIEALRCLGFPRKFLATWIGRTGENIQYFRQQPAGVRVSTHRDVCDMYEKLRSRKPQEFGIDGREINRGLTIARKHDWAPVGCWDDDTIDDPHAFPEWTGACGSYDGLPLCMPCRTVGEAPESRLFGFNSPLFRQLTDKVSIAEMSRETGLLEEAIHRWRRGTAPSVRSKVETVANHFDLDLPDLMTPWAGPLPEWKPIEGFNRFQALTILDIAEMQQPEVAEICGTDKHVINRWLQGRGRPGTPERLQPLADHLGIDIGMFYS
jgi:hypothetical protein